jgi:hypothetical protein
LKSSAESEEEEGVSTTSNVGLACQFCGQRFINKLKLSMHMSRWCKLKPEDYVMEVMDPLTTGSCVGRVEKAILPSFPLMGTTRLLSAAPSVAISGPFACEMCGKEYTLQSTLASHRTRWCKGPQSATEKSHDEDIPESGPYICKYCNKELATSHGLVVHYSRWCPAKDYGPSQDLKAGFETEEASFIEATEAADTSIVSDASEDAILATDEDKFSCSALSAAILWLIDRVDAASAEVTEKLRANRRRK